MKKLMTCETCVFYEYDDEFDMYYCSADMDEDDYARLLQDGRSGCPFWRDGDEYSVVRHQI
ncbi:MAG: hypothetical protein IKN57_00055 [Parasporobacterium sp.]|nr:hypothetical protein [Parasporobacterium sp.]